MKILCITHADFETPGVIEKWAQQRNHSFSVVKPYKGEVIRSSLEFDALIIMGGPQSPLEIEKYPYLSQEINLIDRAIRAQKLVLGFCLGAQLIGEALGAKTERSPEKEVGVFSITLTSKAIQDPILTSMPNTFEAIHWHNDMPGLTQDAVILATSKGCPRQIIRYNSRTYGFQCHLEISKDGIEAMIKNCPDDLTPQKFVQDKTKLLQKNYAHINTQMFSILDQWAQLFIIGARVAPIIDQWKIGHEFGEHIVEIILTGKTFRNNPE